MNVLDMFKLDGKVALVTGVGRGLGQGCRELREQVGSGDGHRYQAISTTSLAASVRHWTAGSRPASGSKMTYPRSQES